MADRMRRVWSPFTNLGFEAMSLGDELEYRIHPSIALEASQDRTMRDWTITRIVGLLQFEFVGETIFLYGVRIAAEAEIVGSINPGTDQTVDWMLWGGFTTTDAGAYGTQSTVEIDNRSQRKSRGMDSSLRLYIYNAAGSTGYFAWTGRVLALFS